jgi:hypothetical protein
MKSKSGADSDDRMPRLIAERNRKMAAFEYVENLKPAGDLPPTPINPDDEGHASKDKRRSKK